MKRFALGMLIAAFVLAGILSYWASSAPDGFEWVGEKLGFLGHGKGQEVGRPPMPDYAVPGLGNRFLSGGLAGVIGVAVVFGALLGAGKLLGRRRRST